MTQTKRYHRLFGLILLLPLCGWIITGTVFLLKPGYQAAYDQLQVKQYPLGEELKIKSSHDWQAFRYFRTVLGTHLLVNINGKWQHLEPATQTPKPLPQKQQLINLISDAISHNPQRYSKVVDIENGKAVTETGIEITLDWQTMKLRQTGQDTLLINTLYKIHYLQWTGSKIVDRILGVVGLIMLFVLSFLGLLLIVRKQR